MRQILNVVILCSEWSKSWWWLGWVGFLEYSQYSGRIDRDREDGSRCFKDAVLREELHLLQAGSGSSGGCGARAGVECVCL